MTLRGDVIKALDKWIENEYGHGICEEGPDIEFCYSEYRGDSTVEEQWIANVDTLRIWLEIDGVSIEEPEAIVYEFNDEAEMAEFIENMTFESLISEADSYIEEHESRR